MCKAKTVHVYLLSWTFFTATNKIASESLKCDEVFAFNIGIRKIMFLLLMNTFPKTAGLHKK